MGEFHLFGMLVLWLQWMSYADRNDLWLTMVAVSALCVVIVSVIAEELSED